jgi:hypothetical protein
VNRHVKIGDLVSIKTHDTGLIGIVINRDHHPSSTQIAIKWFGGSGKTDWEPESWLEVVSESR